MSSMPGVFAAGDVRDGSTKQLASAVGEGAAAAIQIRGYLTGSTADRWKDDVEMPMQPNEIFELIVKADEKLKYATADKAGKQDAAGEGPAHPGSRRRAGDRERAPGPAGRAPALGPRLARPPDVQPRNAVRRTAFCSSVTRSSVRVPVARIVVSI